MSRQSHKTLRRPRQSKPTPRPECKAAAHNLLICVGVAAVAQLSSQASVGTNRAPAHEERRRLQPRLARRRAVRDGWTILRSNVTAAPRPRLRECCLGNLARSVRPTRASCKSHCKEQVGNNEIEPAVVSYSQRLVLRSAKMPVGFVSPKCAAPLALMLRSVAARCKRRCFPRPTPAAMRLEA